MNPHKGKPKKFGRKSHQRVREAAARGVSDKAIAHELGLTLPAFKKSLELDQLLARALDEGRAVEHDALRDALFDLATGQGGRYPNVTAAIFLLKARHDYVEAQHRPHEQAAEQRVNVTFSLPGALPEKDYAVIEHKADDPAQLAHLTGDDDGKR